VTVILPAAVAALAIVPWTDPGRDRNRLNLDQSEMAFIDRGDDPVIIHGLFQAARAGRCRAGEIHDGERYGQMLFGHGTMARNVRADTRAWPAGATRAALRCAFEGYELVRPAVCANWSVPSVPPLLPNLPPSVSEIGPGGSPGWFGGTFGANNEGEVFNAAPSFFLPAPAAAPPPPEVILVTLPAPPPSPPAPEIPEVVTPPGAPTPPATGPPGAPIPEPWGLALLATFLAIFAAARRFCKGAL
jgi:hypothetical protein